MDEKTFTSKAIQFGEALEAYEKAVYGKEYQQAVDSALAALAANPFDSLNAHIGVCLASAREAVEIQKAQSEAKVGFWKRVFGGKAMPKEKLDRFGRQLNA